MAEKKRPESSVKAKTNPAAKSKSGAEVKAGAEAKAKAKGKPWFVYILQCANGSLYTGITTNVEKRLEVHNAGKGSAYVRSNRPAVLVACTTAKNRALASVLEYEVKRLKKEQKIALAKKWGSKQKRTVSV